MLDQLLKNPEKYFWTQNQDGDLVLGNAECGLKGKLTFTLTDKWTNLAPLIESSPGIYIGQPKTFLKDTKEYEQVAALYKKVKIHLHDTTITERGKISKNTLALLQGYYQGK
ncbi:hypothetical protein BZG02_16820 [Labilibaculum filiforme]|uniref:Uncharacterized protein n=1 Tax=Labilibaculum filiforme TaxID=1940526 RepID=A0A2N3HST8_9BACT|nr:hypothetical protein [Labilibaculum filiforme]PKQ61107.1 hypothetical protein BZG02_16820 [Labilibaculum filiforme]